MLTKEKVLEMFQKIYFDSIDRGEMTEAVSIFHEDVEWIHTQVFDHHPHPKDPGSDKLKGKSNLEAYLLKRKKDSTKQTPREHVVKDLVLTLI